MPGNKYNMPRNKPATRSAPKRNGKKAKKKPTR